MGGDLCTLEGHCLSGRFKGVYGLYFWDGSALSAARESMVNSAATDIEKHCNFTHSMHGIVAFATAGGGSYGPFVMVFVPKLAVKVGMIVRGVTIART